MKSKPKFVVELNLDTAPRKKQTTYTLRRGNVVLLNDVPLGSAIINSAKADYKIQSRNVGNPTYTLIGSDGSKKHASFNRGKLGWSTKQPS